MRVLYVSAPVAARVAACAMTMFLFGCSSTKEDAKGGPPQAAAAGADPISRPVPTNGKLHSLAKYIELSGYRLAESKAGTLRIRMNVVNHSGADLGEVTMKVRLMAAGAKAEDPAVTEFQTKVALGPEESKQVETSVPTKLRLYELPDWQFLRGTFEITAP
jgi:hypothetical protein